MFSLQPLMPVTAVYDGVPLDVTGLQQVISTLYSTTGLYTGSAVVMLNEFYASHTTVEPGVTYTDGHHQPCWVRVKWLLQPRVHGGV